MRGTSRRVALAMNYMFLHKKLSHYVQSILSSDAQEYETALNVVSFRFIVAVTYQFDSLCKRKR